VPTTPWVQEEIGLDEPSVIGTLREGQEVVEGVEKVVDEEVRA
jgi:hypothetical protein